MKNQPAVNGRMGGGETKRAGGRELSVGFTETATKYVSFCRLTCYEHYILCSSIRIRQIQIYSNIFLFLHNFTVL